MGINQIFWVAGNIISLLIFVSAFIFAVAYPILFKVSQTTAGRLIWRAIFAVGGFGLLAVIGTFIDGRVNWTEIPPDVEWWRPAIRIVVYSTIAYTYASLVGLLVLRRFFPSRLITAPEPLAAMTSTIQAAVGTGPGAPDAEALAKVILAQGWVHPALVPSDTLNVKPRTWRRP